MWYKENKYSKWYFNIINNARNLITSEYSESHHIIPVCLFLLTNRKSSGWMFGDPDDLDNIVKLTAREHLICHILLPKMVEDPLDVRKLTYALFGMLRIGPGQHRIISSWEYEYIRTQFSKSRKGIIRPQTLKERQKRSRTLMGHKLSEETKRKISIGNKGKTVSKETRELLRKSIKNRPPQSIETRNKRSQTLQGHSVSEETKQKIKISNTGKIHTSQSNLKRSIAAKELIWIRNEFGVKKRIHFTKIEEYLKSGWIKGRGTVKS